MLDSATLELWIDKKVEKLSRIKLSKPNELVGFWLHNLTVDFIEYDNMAKIEKPNPYKTFTEIRINSEYFKRIAQEMNSAGVKLLDAGLYSQSAPYFDWSLTANPNNANPYTNLGIVWDKLNDHKKSIQYSQKAYDLKQDDGMLSNLVVGYLNGGNYPKTIELGNKFITEYPNSKYSKDVVGWLASAYSASGDYQKAIEQNQLTLKASDPKDPQVFRVYLSLAADYMLSKQYPEAIQWYKKTIATLESSTFLDSDKIANLSAPDGSILPDQTKKITLAALYKDMGTAYYNSGQVDLAKTSYIKAIALDPSIYGVNQAFYSGLGISR